MLLTSQLMGQNRLNDKNSRTKQEAWAETPRSRGVSLKAQAKEREIQSLAEQVNAQREDFSIQQRKRSNSIEELKEECSQLKQYFDMLALRCRKAQSERDRLETVQFMVKTKVSVLRKRVIATTGRRGLS